MKTTQTKVSQKHPEFDYSKAFSRNLGLVTEEEQARLRKKRVAIPGCGGVGAIHALALARLGVGHFVLADFDTYEIENFNRQYGAKMSSLGEQKVLAVRREILDINPSAEVSVFPSGLRAENSEDFLRGVDLVVDSLDFFAFPSRDLLFPLAQQKGIPLITAAPLGFSCALLIFTRDSMSYRDYFDFRPDDSFSTRALKFAMGLSPSPTHLKYMASDKVDFESGKGPSSVIGVTLCAGMAAAEGLKVLLGRGNVRVVPDFQQFDAYRGIFRKKRLPFGNRSPIQKFKMWFVKRFFLNKGTSR